MNRVDTNAGYAINAALALACLAVQKKMDERDRAVKRNHQGY
jgi:hypothetical protein